MSIRFSSSGWELPRLTSTMQSLQCPEVLNLFTRIGCASAMVAGSECLVANPTMLTCLLKSNLKKTTNRVQHCHLHTEQVQRTAPLRCHRGQPEQQNGNETKLTADRNLRIRPHRDTRVGIQRFGRGEFFLPWPAPVERKRSFTLLKTRCALLATNSELG